MYRKFDVMENFFSHSTFFLEKLNTAVVLLRTHQSSRAGRGRSEVGAGQLIKPNGQPPSLMRSGGAGGVQDR
jgi:hypothetical protein